MALSVGDPAPNFTFEDKNGNSVELYSVIGKKIVFFFPKAFSDVCTRESISIQDSYSELKELGVTEIFGISVDDQNKLDIFSDEFKLDFNLVGDKKKKISKQYGVYKRQFLFKYADRVTFVINENNIIKHIFHNGFFGDENKSGIENHGGQIAEFIAVNHMQQKLEKKMLEA